MGSLRKRVAALVLGCLAIGAMAPGCGERRGESPSAPARAESIADQEDAVCGMLVREQPAPRGQLVHRDGERAFFCSVGDLLVQLATPSPHGEARTVFVEVLDPEIDPLTRQTAQQPWQRAEDAFYVIGVQRPGIMGEPVLAYADLAAAERIASAHAGAKALGYDELQSWWRTTQQGR